MTVSFIICEKKKSNIKRETPPQKAGPSKRTTNTARFANIIGFNSGWSEGRMLMPKNGKTKWSRSK